MFNIDKLNKKQEMVDGCVGGYREKEVVYIKEEITINKKSENYNIVLDTLNLLKSMDHYQSDLIKVTDNKNELVINLKYKDNIKNENFINVLKDFIKKYKKNKFSNSILSV